MKRITIILVFLLPFLAIAAHAQKGTTYPRTLYVAYDHAPVYDSATYLSSVLGELRMGDTLTVLGDVKKFFRIVFHNREAYILGANVAEKIPAAATRRVNARGTQATEPAPIPVVEPVDSVRTNVSIRPERAGTRDTQSQQCQAITKAGKRCSRMTSDPSGYCWQHKR